MKKQIIITPQRQGGHGNSKKHSITAGILEQQRSSPYHPLYGQSFPILKTRKVDRQRRYSLGTGDDIFSVPESWVTDTGQNVFSESF